MDVEIIERDGNCIRFIVEGVSPAFINSLRRTIMADVPTMAIDEVVIVENNSTIFDEVLAHRLGLIPLTTPEEKYGFSELCECQGVGCPKCNVTFTLKKESGEGITVVYSGDLESSDPEVVPVSPDIVIVKLVPRQKIEVEAFAKMGTGKQNAKWQSVTVSAYKYSMEFDFDPEKCTLCEDCIEACPKQILKREGDEIVCFDPFECTLCDACVEVCDFDAIKIKEDDTKFIFMLEGLGNIPPESIVRQAAQILIKKSQELEEQIGTMSA